jgi:hypothetical protein
MPDDAGFVKSQFAASALVVCCIALNFLIKKFLP